MHKNFLGTFYLCLLTILVSEALVMVILHYFTIESPILEGLVDGLLLTLLVTPILYKLIVEDLLIKNIKLEQVRTSQAMGMTLGHEILNPLTIAIGHAEKIKNLHGEEQTRELIIALNRITNLVTKMRSLEGKEVKFSSLGGEVENVSLD